MSNEEKFRLEFHRDPENTGRYSSGNYTWQTPFRVTLDNTVLGQIKGKEATSLQFPDDRWEPTGLILTGDGVLNGNSYCTLGFNNNLSLRFDPEGEKVRISLTDISPKNVTFDPSKVNPVIIDRAYAAFQLYKGYNDIVADMIEHESLLTNERKSFKEEILDNEQVKELFRKFGIQPASLPKE